MSEESTTPDAPTPPSRRRFLQAGVATAGAAAAAATTAALPANAASAAPRAAATGCPMTGHAHAAIPSLTFGRMFPDLPPFAENTASLRHALHELGAPAGPLDAQDDLFGPNGGPVKLITDPALSAVNRNNPRDTAGVTFFGQFIDHDLTFDATSRLGIAADPHRSPNSRTPCFDLDSVYGGGPIAQSELYDPAEPIKLLVESGGRFEDVPRRADNSAIIGDPRNDSNLIVSGLHAAFLKFHNHAVDVATSPQADPMVRFQAARKTTTWHYQWLVAHRLLPLFVGQHLVDDVLRHGPRYFHPHQTPYVPVEFSGAAYRFGHSMVRPSYRANLAGDNGDPFFGLIFDSRISVPDGQNPPTEPDDLRGGFRAPRRFVGWQTFFDFGGVHTAQVRPNKRIDTVLSTPLFALPLTAIAHVPGAPGPTALPQRTLLRHLTWSLPSGQAVARRLGYPTLGRADFTDLAPFGHRLDRSTPLWLYVLREAQLVHGGRLLGPVGGRIVAEVLLGLLQADPASVLNAAKPWRPTLGNSGGEYEVADFLRFAGVDPDTRGE